VQESQTIAAGEELKGQINPNNQLRLALENQGKLPATDITVALESNAQIVAKPSDFFQTGDVPTDRPYLWTSVWKSKPGTTMSALPKKALSKEEGLRLTTLELGRFSITRTFGVFYLKIIVSAKDVPGQAEYKVSLKLQ
jgi:hypothetical protein